MKRAVALPAYSNTDTFLPPSGIVTVDIDPETLQLATPGCPQTRREVFIEGTQPTQYCQKHGGVANTVTSWFAKLFGKKKSKS
jgi:membrane carboxypeptidase/penicillin-binding protein